MTQKTFHELVSEAMDAIERQRQEDRKIYDRLCNTIVRYDGRHRDPHELKQDVENLRANLSTRGKHVAAFSVKDGKVQIGQEQLSETDALPRLAEMLAKKEVEIKDERERRR